MYFSNSKISATDCFLSFVRRGLGHVDGAIPYTLVDWMAVKKLADAQGLSAIVLDGIDRLFIEGRLPSSCSMDTTFKKQWIGEVIHNFEARYQAYEKAVGSLAEWYNQHGFKMMVLKGYACSMDWPNPKHRPCGDIDIWQFGQWREADEALANEKRIRINSTHHHHTVFEWQGFTVENHYDFINVFHHKSNAEFEKVLKEHGKVDGYYVEVKRDSSGPATKVYIPSPNLHALFLLKHLMMHFASEGITLRQVLDWGFFVEKHGRDVDWKMAMEVLDRFGMRQMFNILNPICVGNLGFDARIFPEVQFEPGLNDRVLNDILTPEYGSDVPSRFIPRVCYKIRRWRANEWKHRLCYKESMWSAFWSGLWSHLLKPSSF